jgi:tRNA (cytidine/uridine-2'-O-)-methyltransferase
MDYGGCADVSRHDSWEAFTIWRETEAPTSRVILFTTKTAAPYCDFLFRPSDILLFGRESAGAPAEVHAYADARLFIPISAHTRSINVINSASMALGEALRQTRTFPVRP